MTPSEPVIVVAPATADSLAPQVVPPASTSLPVVAPAGLEEDDLAVLPGRRRAAGSGRRRYGLVLLGLLCFAAAIVIGVKGRGVSEAGGGVSAASPTDGTVALPPPPPSDDELVATSLEEEPPAAPVRRGASGAEPVDDGLDPLDPRRLSGGGPNVRRYADVPTPTLSKLAREQRRLARERDEAARKAKASVPR